MAQRKNKADQIHDQLPKVFDSRNNPNFKALVAALGIGDQEVANTIEEVRKQLFVKTASRPYIDRLGANVKVSRPRFIGMQDPSFREYIPVLSYQPKQVKIILDKLLDLFFFKESTTSFIQSVLEEPFELEDGWSLEYKVDEINTERIEFKAENFTDISNATGDEIVAAINRESKHSYAIAYQDSISKKVFIRIFTNTVGSKGSIEITGGRANIGLRFSGFIADAGNGSSTEWNITKIGDKVTYTWTTNGADPGIQFLNIGDVVLTDLAGNKGSFVIESVSVSDRSFSFRNLFGTTGTIAQTTDKDVKFLTPIKSAVYKNDRRALAWEVKPGEITVEMPASPPIVQRKLNGSMHINGVVSLMTNRDSSTSLTVDNASKFSTSGQFWLEEAQELKVRILTSTEDEVVTTPINSRISSCNQVYTYTGITGNTLTGISPDLPIVASLNQQSISSSVRASNTVTVTTATDHGYQVGNAVIISGATAGTSSDLINGTFIIKTVPTSASFTIFNPGTDGTNSGGETRAEIPGLANSGSKVILKTAQTDTGILGPYIWDANAGFVLSSLTADMTSEIQAGNTARTVEISTPNNIPEESGLIIFDFGTREQEGPVRYFFKASDAALSIDPAYVFKHNHDIGSAVTVLRRRGAHQISTSGLEYAPYVTDPSVGRVILQELMEEVKSVGIFLNFLVRYPEQFYATIDVYQSGDDPG